MDSDLVANLNKKIESLQQELLSKDKKIHELQEALAKFQSTHKTKFPIPITKLMGKKPGWSSIKNAFRFKSFMSNTIKFCHSSHGDHSKIEFPASSSAQPPDRLHELRGLSTNVLIIRVLENIRKITSRKNLIQDEISKNREEINESSRKAIEAMEKSYNIPLKSLQEDIVYTLKILKEEIETGLVIEASSQRLFLVQNIDTESLDVTLIQLKDAYGIALKDQKTLTKSIYDFENMRAVIKSENDEIMNNLDRCKLIIYYQLIEIENNEKICCPMSILPEGIGLQDYEIKFSNTQFEITEVLNKNDGQVKFNTIVVSEECGLVQASVIELYTYEISDHILNIVHLHIEDMKEEIPLDAVYILPDQSSKEYEDWSKDFTGVDLRYKLLVKSGKVEAVLYNTGSTTEYIHFIERRVLIGDYYKYGDYIIQLMSVPTGLLTRDWQGKKSECDLVYTLQKPESYCLARHASDLPGLVDIKIIMSQGEYVKDGTEMAVPVCQCLELGAKEKTDLQQIFRFLEENKNNFVDEQVKRIEILIGKYKSMEVKDGKGFLNELTGVVRDVKESISQDNEMRNKYQGIIGQAERVIRNVAIDIRING